MGRFTHPALAFGLLITAFRRGQSLLGYYGGTPVVSEPSLLFSDLANDPRDDGRYQVTYEGMFPVHVSHQKGQDLPTMGRQRPIIGSESSRWLDVVAESLTHVSVPPLQYAELQSPRYSEQPPE